MAFGNGTFSNASAAVSDLLTSSANADGLRIKAGGTRLSADALRIQAEGGRLKAKGDEMEAGNYDLAATLALQNEDYTKQSTAIQQLQSERQLYQGMGTTRADVGGAGFQVGGSALDILRDSASQGAMQKAVMGQQGLITEAGYHEQATSFTNLANYARYAATQEYDMANKTDEIAGKTDLIAGQEDALAKKTESNGWIMAGVHGASAIASLFTGGFAPSPKTAMDNMPTDI